MTPLGARSPEPHERREREPDAELSSFSRPSTLGDRAGLVMVVDDDPDIRSTLSRLLQREGFDVIAEADGSAALNAVTRLKPDLILLDVLLPGLGGFEVCRRLKGSFETRLIPILLLTGLAGTDDKIRGLEAGADEFLSKPPDRAELLARVRSLIRVKGYTDRLVRAESVVLSLARSIEGKDPHTEGHCERLSDYATRLGRHLGLGGDALEALSYGGFLHDIGKVAVPDSILLKKGPLTTAEWEEMRKHPVAGEHICRPVHSFHRVLPIIRHHHERWNGSGYPDGLIGEAIPITARVLQIADIFDALTSSRPYKPAFHRDQALQIMREEVGRGWWDPACFAAFEEIVKEAPDDFLGELA